MLTTVQGEGEMKPRERAILPWIVAATMLVVMSVAFYRVDFERLGN
jgi:type II secretory pathway component PulM